MTYVIALPCVDLKDKACIDECPVDCIYEGERSLYIHPDECVDCGACEPVCPVEAIYYEDDLPDEWQDYYKANVEFFDEIGSPGGAARTGPIRHDHPSSPRSHRRRCTSDPAHRHRRRGPRGHLRRRPPPGAGAGGGHRPVREASRPVRPRPLRRRPDHPRIRKIIDALHDVLLQPGIRLRGNVEVGVDVTVDELCRAYDGVVIATGADRDVAFDVPGADLPGSYGAAEFVAWYDAHPDVAQGWGLEAESVAVLGAGNVALDVTRILAKHAAALESTDTPTTSSTRSPRVGSATCTSSPAVARPMCASRPWSCASWASSTTWR